MKIETGSIPPAVAFDRAPGTGRSKGAAKPEQASEESFSVHLSEEVKNLVEGNQGEDPGEDEIRWEKVAAIRQQLAAGRYNISGKDVAAKILGVISS